MSTSGTDSNRPAFRERLTQPFRVLFQEGFLAAWHKHTLFSMISLSILGIAVATGVWWFGLREDDRPADMAVDRPPSSHSETDISEVAEQLRADEVEWARIQEDGRRQEEIALARYRLTCVRQLADRAKDAIDACRDEAIEWTEDMKDFENASIDWSEASNRALLGRVDMLLSLETPDKNAADDLDDRHKALISPLDRAESLGEATPVSSSLESSIEELADTAREMRDLYQRRRAMLGSIRSATQVSSQENVPALAEAIESYRAELAAEQQTRIDGQLAEARAQSEAALLEVEESAAKALAEAKQKAAEVEGQIEVERVAAEARRKSLLQEVADTEAEVQAEREKLEREFQMDLPKIKHYLVAFTTVDKHHPIKGTTIEQMPFPLSYLESEGALIPSDGGFRRLADIASDDIGKRPIGPLLYMETIYTWRDSSPERREATIIAQELLRKYGLLMVEKKMLLP